MKTKLLLMIDQLREKGFCFFTIEDWIAFNEDNKLFYTYNYFIIIWTSSKSLSGSVESEPYVVKPNHLLFISPNKKLQLSVDDFDGYVFAFNPKFFVRSNFDSSLINSHLFFNENQEVTICPFKSSAEYFENFYVRRLEELSNTNQETFLLFAHNTIEALILEGTRSLGDSLHFSSPESSLPDQVTVNKFIVLLQKHFKKEKRVSFYADLLNITPRSLNKAIFNVLQKHAKDIIIEKVVKESKRMLAYTNEAVYSIAWEIGFVDEGNFSSFFKKHSGKNPAEYRETARASLAKNSIQNRAN